ncbi:MAG TPA: helix-turn-helix domain-containing protein [Gemmatimonadaceae bacterium]
MPRDRFATRAAILRSAAELVAAHGVNAVGVNALAQAAGCDKVLIYRYFGGLDGVLAALGMERMLWPRVEVDSNGGGADRDGDASLAELMQSVVLEEWAAFAGGALMLQAEVAELEGGNALGRAAAAQRSERHAEIIASLRANHRIPPYVDLEALLELLSAALTLFALRAASGSATKTARMLEPSTPEGWRRIEKTVGTIVRALLESE